MFLFYFSESKKPCSHNCPSRLIQSLSAVCPTNLCFPKDVWAVSKVLSVLKRNFKCFLITLNYLIIYSFNGKEREPQSEIVRAGLAPHNQVLCTLPNSNYFSCSCRGGNQACPDKVNLVKINEHHFAYTLLSESSQHSGKYFQMDSEK